MEDVLLRLIEAEFLRKVQREKERNPKQDHFYKWVQTFHLSEIMGSGTSTAKIRSCLIKAEEKGLVIADRTYKNTTGWALPKYDGFEDHKYRGYLKEIEK